MRYYMRCSFGICGYFGLSSATSFPLGRFFVRLFPFQLFQGFDIAKVFCPSGCLFVPYEIIGTDERYLQTVNFGFQTGIVRFVEVNTGYGVKDVYTQWGIAQLGNVVFPQEIILGKPKRCKSEICYYLDHLTGVFSIGLYPYIEVSRMPRPAVYGKGIRTDHHVLYLMLVQKLDEIDKILFKHHGSAG